MDFTPTEAQAGARDLAARIFGDLSTHERLRAAGTGSDPELFKALCTAGLVGAVAELGLLGLVLLLEEQGRTTAQVPYAATCVYGSLAITAHGTPEQRERLLPGIEDGSVVVAGALPAQPGVRAVARGELTGSVPFVPWLRDATHVLVADAARRLWLAPLGEGTAITPVELTAPWSAARLTLERAPAQPLGAPGAYADLLATARTAFAGLQAGVCAGSLARAVAHTNTREQFGRPLATRQAVQLRAADAHMDTEAIRVTAYEAAWRRDAGLPYATHALTAAWWASEAGQRVVHSGQHLHGGAGADVDHPVHRHFLWGRQLDAHLGCGAEVLQELGELIAHGE
ncbi:alkylation response protein AidB-like acyl-CoA dehydrogenase [Streptomyces griseochromogenes]|uniref:Acyl-CoA dehydrogenase n=1 Tax=Streptomyces griseochromogenes TaxID=68214 RepID=A0A1B1BBB1_9ACTN|nr:acyl-CoA dehydrogenase family protein [Streptomyces griseochromogenes]ANP56108.1 acyl-CoA dehydrogenase [Streptomyces griseochromogenes]MBP2051025.1 alkylation response protein AidB-like acyl-CoA dehydrogenase [Streptomyces griseochromogenes]